MKAHLRSKVWFPAMDKKIEEAIKFCKSCVMVVLPDKPHPMSRRIPSESFFDLAMDFKEGLLNSEYLLVVACIATRCIFTETMRNPTSSQVCTLLLKLFSQYGIPRTITAGNDPQFQAVELKRFCQSYGIHLNNTTSYWTEQNSAVGDRIATSIGNGISLSH